jgi:hypothetical protein
MEELKHCSYCKYYYCSPNHQMICFYGGISKKLTSKRRNICKNFELMDEYNKTYVYK